MTTTHITSTQPSRSVSAPAGSRRVQGWIIALSASAVLWTAIITGVIGLTNLLR
jgi:hypothetical protein